ncbi:S-adenosylhomocysteine deaminase [Komagataeibacter medellinensis]|uniref:S-adenosylhomocysteine deaminase n=1 Tax=Komagataeibacter medellinensis TaxID=1177712 RepID=A0ABQ6VUN5_9PROT|nr:amidohydrolase family protein [Komagataeibacter medellinensis]KAB8122548.1 S-adenosylhomocysteine deaminase [Komagataeibacter medellinensis]
MKLIAGTTIMAATMLCLTPRAHADAANRQASLLVKNAYIFSMADKYRKPFTGYMLIDASGTITAIAPGAPGRRIHATTTLDAHGHWVMPGFISAHSHLWQAAYRGLAQDSTLLGWLDALYDKTASHARPEDFYWFTLDGALDHLQHGITTAYNFNYGNHWGQPATEADNVDHQQFRAEMDSGLRFVHGINPTADTVDHSLAGARQHLRGFIDWTQAQPASTAFLSIMLNGTAAFQGTPARALDEAMLEGSLMKEFGLGNQTHYLEPPDHVAAQQAIFPYFAQSGMMGPKLIFGHFIHTTPEILAQTGRAGAAMSWNPLSNGRLASGTADIPTYLKNGIRVGMGEDGEASADLADPFENMRTGLYAIRDRYQSASIMSPYDVLRLHTVGSAAILQASDRLGSLERGKYADFLIIDPTHLAHVFDPYATLVLAASMRDLEQVYVGGHLVVDHGRVLTRDINTVEAQADQRVAASLPGHDRHH